MNAPLTRQHHLLAAIGHASRFRLFLLLAAQERCVTELAAQVGLSQSCTTRHLQALGAAGVVAHKREGKRVRFRLRLERADVAGLLAWAVGAAQPATAHAAHSAPAAPAEAAAPPRRARVRRAPGAAAALLPPAPAPEAAISGTNGALAAAVTEPAAPAAEDVPRPRAARHDLEDFLL